MATATGPQIVLIGRVSFVCLVPASLVRELPEALSSVFQTLSACRDASMTPASLPGSIIWHSGTDVWPPLCSWQFPWFSGLFMQSEPAPTGCFTQEVGCWCGRLGIGSHSIASLADRPGHLVARHQHTAGRRPCNSCYMRGAAIQS
jgi:hypothetical protein